MSHESLARQVLLATPTGKRPKNRPRTRWSDYISDLARSPLGVEPAELYIRLLKTVRYFAYSQGCWPRHPPKWKIGNEIDEYVTSSAAHCTADR